MPQAASCGWDGSPERVPPRCLGVARSRPLPRHPRSHLRCASGGSARWSPGPDQGSVQPRLGSGCRRNAQASGLASTAELTGSGATLGGSIGGLGNAAGFASTAFGVDGLDLRLGLKRCLRGIVGLPFWSASLSTARIGERLVARWSVAVEACRHLWKDGVASLANLSVRIWRGALGTIIVSIVLYDNGPIRDGDGRPIWVRAEGKGLNAVLVRLDVKLGLLACSATARSQKARTAWAKFRALDK